MTYIVLDGCIKCKYMDCVDVCPVECFHEGETMVVIDPGACIDCGVCVPECPAKAIVPDTRENVPNLEMYARLNVEYTALWPLITRKGIPPADADAHKEVTGKYPAQFSPVPGLGDAGREKV